MDEDTVGSAAADHDLPNEITGYGKFEYTEYPNISGFSRRPRAAQPAHGAGAQFLVGLAAGCRRTFSPPRSQALGCGSTQSGQAAGKHRAVQAHGSRAG